MYCTNDLIYFRYKAAAVKDRKIISNDKTQIINLFV